jgi:hypothetical protein
LARSVYLQGTAGAEVGSSTDSPKTEKKTRASHVWLLATRHDWVAATTQIGAMTSRWPGVARFGHTMLGGD